jgi:hypothetical protein
MQILTLAELLNLIGPIKNDSSSMQRFNNYLTKYINGVGDIAEYVQYATNNCDTIVMQELNNHIGKLLGFNVKSVNSQTISSFWNSKQHQIVLLEEIATVKEDIIKYLQSHKMITASTKDSIIYLKITNSAIEDSSDFSSHVKPIDLIKLLEFIYDSGLDIQRIINLVFKNGLFLEDYINLLSELSIRNIQINFHYNQSSVFSGDEDWQYFNVPIACLELAKSMQIINDNFLPLKHDDQLITKVKEGDWLVIYQEGFGIIGYGRIDGLPIHLPSSRKEQYRLSDDFSLYISLKESTIFTEPLILDHAKREKMDAFATRGADKSWRWFVADTQRITAKDFRILTES